MSSDAQKRLFALLKSDVIRIKGKRVRLSSRKSGSEASSERQAPQDESRPLNTTGQLLGNDRKRSAHGQTVDDIQCSDQNQMKATPHLEKTKKRRKAVAVELEDSESGSKEVLGVSEVWSGGGGAQKATEENDDEERDNDDNAATASNRELMILRSRTRTNRCDTPTI